MTLIMRYSLLFLSLTCAQIYQTTILSDYMAVSTFEVHNTPSGGTKIRSSRQMFMDDSFHFKAAVFHSL